MFKEADTMKRVLRETMEMHRSGNETSNPSVFRIGTAETLSCSLFPSCCYIFAWCDKLSAVFETCSFVIFPILWFIMETPPHVPLPLAHSSLATDLWLFHSTDILHHSSGYKALTANAVRSKANAP